MARFEKKLSIKTTNLISRILFQHYHLSGRNITVTVLLPTLKLRRAAFKRFYTWHYSTQGLPVHHITAAYRRLLPYIFTLTVITVDNNN